MEGGRPRRSPHRGGSVRGRAPVTAAASDEATPLWAYLPGLAALVVVGLAGRLVGAAVPYLDPLVGAVAVGALVANTVGVPASFLPGVETNKLWLETGIVLMGARITLGALLDAGPTLALVVVVGVTATVLLVEGLSRTLFDVPRRLGSLLAAGAGICGVSAVVGVSGSVRADENQIAYAAATVLLFDLLTLFAYPALGGVLGLSDRVFGVWAGLTMFSTGPVTAAGFAVSEAAGRWATVTKLARNLLLGGLVLAYSLYYVDGQSGDASSRTSRSKLALLWRSFPKFVVGFFAVVALSSAGAFSRVETAQLTTAYEWLFLVAFAGLGLTVDLDDLRNAGLRPVAVVLTALLVVSSVSLVAIRTAFGP
ncbi:putative sulfate exporter family transporter [halophilic archaeon]|nr:putative sulfate exporter family transporter [halophilic archaeon]